MGMGLFFEIEVAIGIETEDFASLMFDADMEVLTLVVGEWALLRLQTRDAVQFLSRLKSPPSSGNLQYSG
jgi:hypothetical protein